MTLSRRQRDAADAIIDLNVALGRPPTIGELAERLTLGNTATFALVTRLRTAGFLRADERIALSPYGMIHLSDAVNALLAAGQQPGGYGWPKP